MCAACVCVCVCVVCIELPKFNFVYPRHFAPEWGENYAKSAANEWLKEATKDESTKHRNQSGWQVYLCVCFEQLTLLKKQQHSKKAKSKTKPPKIKITCEKSKQTLHTEHTTRTLTHAPICKLCTKLRECMCVCVVYWWHYFCCNPHRKCALW